MQIERVVVGDLQENCYIISQNEDCLLVDPGAEFHKIKDKVGDRKVVGVLLTHHHFDHVGAINIIRQSYMIFISYKKKNILLAHFNFR